MEYEMCPVVDAGAIENALADKMREWNEDFIAPVLFGDEYGNDCYKAFYIKEDRPIFGLPYEDSEVIKRMNYVRAYLRSVLPEGTDKVLIDVRW